MIEDTANRATAKGVQARQHDTALRSPQHRRRCGRLSSGNPSRLLPDPARLQSPGEQFYTDSAGQRAHPFKSRGDPAPKQVGRREGAMHGSQRYRYNAKECLLAAKEASQPYHRKLRLSMASSWLSLACQDEAMDNLLASLDKPSTALVAGASLVAHTVVGAHNEHFLRFWDSTFKQTLRRSVSLRCREASASMPSARHG